MRGKSVLWAGLFTSLVACGGDGDPCADANKKLVACGIAPVSGSCADSLSKCIESCVENGSCTDITAYYGSHQTSGGEFKSCMDACQTAGGNSTDAGTSSQDHPDAGTPQETCGICPSSPTEAPTMWTCKDPSPTTSGEPFTLTLSYGQSSCVNGSDVPMCRPYVGAGFADLDGTGELRCDGSWRSESQFCQEDGFWSLSGNTLTLTNSQYEDSFTCTKM